MGEKAGHPFRGNQFTSSKGGGKGGGSGVGSAAQKRAEERGGKAAWLNGVIAKHNVQVRSGVLPPEKPKSFYPIPDQKVELRPGTVKDFERVNGKLTAIRSKPGEMKSRVTVTGLEHGTVGVELPGGERLTAEAKSLRPQRGTAERMTKAAQLRSQRTLERSVKDPAMKAQAKLMKKTAQGVEAYGVKGMHNKDWRKEFKNRAALDKWAEKSEADIHGTRASESAYAAKTWRKQRADLLRGLRKAKRS